MSPGPRAEAGSGGAGQPHPDAGVAAARERACAFLAASGDPRLAAGVSVLRGEAPRDRVLDQLAPWQRDEGCFADAGGDPLAGTRRALGLLDDVRVLDAPLVARACDWLARVQAEDGGFGAERPEPERIALTGLLVAHLAKSSRARAATLDAAGDFLAARFSPDLVKATWPALAGYAAAFANLPHEQSDAILQWCGRELGRGFATRRFDALRTARVLLWCDAPALPGAPLSARELVAPLAAAQAADGGFAPGVDAQSAAPAWEAELASAADPRAGATWDALVALVRLAP